RDQPILAGYRLVIRGQQLRGDFTSVSVGGAAIIPVQADITDSQITVALPGALAAGIHGVQVVQQRLMGSPPALHQGEGSNLAAFVLHPQITGQISVSNQQVAQDGTRSADVTMNVSPDIGGAQRVVLLLNRLNLTPASPPSQAEGVSYSFISSSRIN